MGPRRRVRPAILDDLVRARPDYIAVAHKDTSEYGVGFFGADGEYGLRIMEWLREHYHRVFLSGAEPLRSPAFGIEVLERNDR